MGTLATWSLGAVLPLSLAGCTNTIDLRLPVSAGDGNLSTSGDAACGPGRRVDPETGICEPCTRDDPRTKCPCDFWSGPGDFPYCEGDDAVVHCIHLCNGNISSCNAYTEIEDQPWVSDCDLFRACCDSLRQDPTSEPCCPPGESLLCFFSTGPEPWTNAFYCLSNQACETPCSEQTGCDRPFQTCQDDKCWPGCDPATEFCDLIGTGYECRFW